MDLLAPAVAKENTEKAKQIFNEEYKRKNDGKELIGDTEGEERLLAYLLAMFWQSAGVEIYRQG